MKCFLSVCLFLVLTLTLSACGAAKEIPPISSAAEASQSKSEPSMSSVHIEEPTVSVPMEKTATDKTQEEEETTLQISIYANENTVIFELNDSKAAKDLYSQLPLSIEVENYSNNEKIFYPTKELDVTDTPLHKSGGSGTLAYYSPWDNVVIFYGDSNPAGGLYELGHAISGGENISSMSGTIEVAQANDK